MSLPNCQREINESNAAFRNADFGSLIYGSNHYYPKAGQSPALTGGMGVTHEEFSAPGVLPTDFVIGGFGVNSGIVAVTKIVAGTDTITVYATSDIPNGAKLNYLVMRAFNA
jgi:hypothetical protein